MSIQLSAALIHPWIDRPRLYYSAVVLIAALLSSHRSSRLANKEDGEAEMGHAL